MKDSAGRKKVLKIWFLKDFINLVAASLLYPFLEYALDFFIYYLPVDERRRLLKHGFTGGC